MTLFSSNKKRKKHKKEKTKKKVNSSKLFRRKKKSKSEVAETFTKRKVSMILFNAIIWVYLSYILAFVGRENIAEQLSITVVKVIIYTFIPYLCKALFENIFKYKWNGSDPSEMKTASEVIESLGEDNYVPAEVSSKNDIEISQSSDMENTDEEEMIISDDEPVG